MHVILPNKSRTLRAFVLQLFSKHNHAHNHSALQMVSKTMIKLCKGCNQEKEAKLFSKARNNKDGLHYWCKQCNKDYRTKNKDRYKEVAWVGHLRYKYGISKDDYNNILEKQKNKCAICGGEQAGRKKRLCVDHCHKTGTIRGLLCCTCNTAIGKFKDNTKFLEKAIKYLKERRG